MLRFGTIYSIDWFSQHVFAWHEYINDFQLRKRFAHVVDCSLNCIGAADNSVNLRALALALRALAAGKKGTLVGDARC